MSPAKYGAWVYVVGASGWRSAARAVDSIRNFLVRPWLSPSDSALSPRIRGRFVLRDKRYLEVAPRGTLFHRIGAWGFSRNLRFTPFLVDIVRASNFAFDKRSVIVDINHDRWFFSSSSLFPLTRNCNFNIYAFDFLPREMSHILTLSIFR